MFDRLVYLGLALIAAAAFYAAWNIGRLDLTITVPAIVIGIAALIGIVVFAKWRGVFARKPASSSPPVSPSGKKPPQE